MPLCRGSDYSLCFISKSCTSYITCTLIYSGFLTIWHSCVAFSELLSYSIIIDWPVCLLMRGIEAFATWYISSSPSERQRRVSFWTAEALLWCHPKLLREPSVWMKLQRSRTKTQTLAQKTGHTFCLAKLIRSRFCYKTAHKKCYQIIHVPKCELNHKSGVTAQKAAVSCLLIEATFSSNWLDVILH